MKLSVNWLRKYIDFDCSIGELADGLTMAGLEVEEIVNLTKEDFIKAGGEGLADDTVFDVKVTPNRGDWLSMIGVAREAMHLVNGSMRLPEPRVESSPGPSSSELIKIRIDDPDLCRRYVGIVVRNATVSESPGWMKDALIAAGMHPINNVVDITNYVMLELGQPLHAFDLKLLHDAQIIVRRAKPGERIVSLDGAERKLEADTLVIADADRAVAIAGVMGGADSEISKQTKDILIESANFNSVSIRRTAKRLGMLTESSYRFERGVDPSICALAALRAAELIADLAGGSVAGGVVDVYPVVVEPLKIAVRCERVNAMLGTALDSEQMRANLCSLGIETSVKDGTLNCQVPTFRSDITREIDIVEEVGRVFGYDNLEMTLPEGSSQGKDSPTGVFREKLRRILISAGAQEALTHSLVESAMAEATGQQAERVIIRNPLTEGLDSMRTAISPNLLQVVARNQAYGTADVNVFEIGKVYFRKSGEIGEKLSVAGAMVGSLWRSAWALPAKALDVDFFACKGLVESLLSGIGICGASFVATEIPLLHPTRAAKIVVGGNDAGIIGEVASVVSEGFGVRGRSYIYELDFQALMDASPVVLKYTELPRYPAMTRHMAVVINDRLRYEELAALAREAGGEMVERIELLDIYRGDKLSADEASLTVSVVFRSRERTLVDDEVNDLLSKIKETLTRKLSASFR